ncbi:MAG: HAD hydrolase family protein, partial [Actinobacteria bacterium]|nr:HAD hydrolase family protein [Actinomycetota bacterium]
EEINLALEEAGFGQFVFIDNGVIPRKSPTLDVSELHAYHLVPKGVSKEQALEKDREYRRFKKEETVAIGDAVADLPFSETAGAFFMVRNGLEDNPQLAEAIERKENVFVTEGRVGDGWAEVVETVVGLY